MVHHKRYTEMRFRRRASRLSPRSKASDHGLRFELSASLQVHPEPFSSVWPLVATVDPPMEAFVIALPLPPLEMRAPLPPELGSPVVLVAVPPAPVDATPPVATLVIVPPIAFEPPLVTAPPAAREPPVVTAGAPAAVAVPPVAIAPPVAKEPPIVVVPPPEDLPPVATPPAEDLPPVAAENAPAVLDEAPPAPLPPELVIGVVEQSPRVMHAIHTGLIGYAQIDVGSGPTFRGHAVPVIVFETCPVKAPHVPSAHLARGRSKVGLEVIRRASGVIQDAIADPVFAAGAHRPTPFRANRAIRKRKRAGNAFDIESRHEELRRWDQLVSR